MLNALVYIFLVLLEVVFLIGFIVYMSVMVFSSLKGSPYVPTKRGKVEEILREANLKRGQNLIEIGSGDGRLAIMAALKYGVRSLGIDINPALTKYATLLAERAKAKNVTFKTANILNEDLSKGDVIYIFLMPELIKKMRGRLTKLKKNALVISHGFKVPYLEKKLVKTLEGKPFPTYFYRV